MTPAASRGRTLKNSPIDLAPGLGEVVGIYKENVAGFESVEYLQWNVLYRLGDDLCAFQVVVV